MVVARAGICRSFGGKPPGPLLWGGRTRRQAPSWLGRGRRPFYTSVPSRGGEFSLICVLRGPACGFPTERRQPRDRTSRAGRTVCRDEEHWPASDAR